MIPNQQIALNQQYQQGCNLGQQGMVAESTGNVPMAIQLYDQSIAWIWGSIVQARQLGLFVPAHIPFALAVSHFAAARMKFAAGWLPASSAHLGAAIEALNQAITINPGVAQFHALAGNILAIQGNWPWAEQALQRAVQLNPNDAWSQWMLAWIHSAQGNMVAANQYYGSAVQGNPGMPGLPQTFAGLFGAQGGGGQGSQPHGVMDVLNTLKPFAELVNNVFGAFNTGWSE